MENNFTYKANHQIEQGEQNNELEHEKGDVYIQITTRTRLAHK